MKRTVNERIAGLKGMMERMESPQLVIEETHAIFAEIDTLEGEEREKAISTMFELATDLMEEVKESPLKRVMDILGKVGNANIIPVSVKVKEFNDVTVIEIDKKIPYKNMLDLLNQARKNFNETVTDLYSASYCGEGHIHIEYNDDKNKEIIIDINEWNMCEDVAKVYIEGLVEYISK